MIRKTAAACLFAIALTATAAANDFSDQAREIAGGNSRLSLIASCIAQLTGSLSGPSETDQTRGATELRLSNMQQLFNDEADRLNVPANVAADVLAIKLLPVETTSLTLMPPGMVAVDPCLSV